MFQFACMNVMCVLHNIFISIKYICVNNIDSVAKKSECLHEFGVADLGLKKKTRISYESAYISCLVRPRLIRKACTCGMY